MTDTAIIREEQLLEEEFAMADPDGLHGAVTRIEMKLDTALANQAARDIQTARELALVEASAKSAHKRLDDHEEAEKAKRAEVWAVRLAILGLIGTAVVAAVGKATGKW